MRLVSFRRGPRESFGVVSGDGVVDLGARLPGVGSLRRWLDAHDLEELRRHADRTPADVPLDGVELLPPVPVPEKIFCIGVNYPERHEEYGETAPPPAYPSVFMRTPGSIVGHLGRIIRPLESRELDYEGEVAVVVARRGRRIPEADAARYLAGITCANDGTLRDWVRHGRFNVTPGKNFERSGSVGPWLCTLDEVGPLDDLVLTTEVNGERRQHESTRRLLFSIPRIVAYLSTFSELAPGDVILTGTPPGAGARREPSLFLVPGDRVDVSIASVGTLTNTVVDEDPD
jgi:5-carboxymethyl-2-hydroxymuconate isomerase